MDAVVGISSGSGWCDGCGVCCQGDASICGLVLISIDRSGLDRISTLVTVDFGRSYVSTVLVALVVLDTPDGCVRRLQLRWWMLCMWS